MNGGYPDPAPAVAEVAARQDRVLRLDVSSRMLTNAALILVGGYLTIRLWPIVVMIAFALIQMCALLPIVTALNERGVPRTLAMLLALAIPLGVLAALLPLVIPSLVEEFADIDQNLPIYAAEVDRYLEGWGLTTNLEEAVRQIDLRRYTGPSAVINQPVLFGILSGVTVVVLTGYLLVELPRIETFLYHFVPRGREAEVRELGIALRKVVGGYIRGQAITSAAISVFTLVVLIAVGAPNPLAFAVVAGIADIIPIVGGLIAVVPATIATLGVSVERALIVLVSLVAYQQFEDRFLLPRVYAATLHLPTLVVFVVVLAGAQLLGVIGILLALPAVAGGRVLLEYVLRRKQVVPITSAPSTDMFAPDNHEEVQDLR